jgi:hypothetical protein
MKTYQVRDLATMTLYIVEADNAAQARVTVLSQHRDVHYTSVSVQEPRVNRWNVNRGLCNIRIT